MLYLRSLFLRNFRLYKEERVVFSPRLNTFWGNNAQGKTSLLEAIYCLISGRSFRSRSCGDLIRHGSDSFFIDATLKKEGIDQNLRFASDGKERKMSCNQTPCSSIGEWIGVLPGVVIAPDDPLIQGSPQQRRLYLDLLNAQTDPLYTHFLARYNRALRQKNRLLKQRQTVTIDSWEEEMATAASYLIQKRMITTETIQKQVEELYLELSGENSLINLTYRSNVVDPLNQEETRNELLRKWRDMRARELVQGYTSIGPHRDDLVIANGEHLFSEFGSEGQKRTCVATLRIAAWQHLFEQQKEPPLLLVDDVGISLDPTRRDKLFEKLSTMGQVFLTMTEPPSPALQKLTGFSYQVEEAKTTMMPEL